MRLVKQSFEIWEQEPGIIGVFKQIERAARLSYKSEENITDDSATEFVSRMVNMGHWATLEHGTVYLVVPQDDPNYYHLLSKYKNNPYSVCNYSVTFNDAPIGNLYITSNYRVLLENKWLKDLKYICGPLDMHSRRITVRLICDRGISHEVVRHRVFSFMQTSSRWCNYSSNRFNNEITYIIPSWLSIPEGEYEWEDSNPLLTAGASIEEVGYDDSSNLWIKDDSDGRFHEFKRHYDDWESVEDFMESLQKSEDIYFELLKQSWKPQQARNVLPNALKTELAITGFAKDYWGEYWLINKSTNKVEMIIPGRSWKDVDLVSGNMYNVVEKGFFPLRCSKAAHPQMRELIIPLRDKFYEIGL